MILKRLNFNFIFCGVVGMPAITVNLPLDILQEVERIRKRQGKSRSEVIAELLRKALG